jgi:hypothetical protein
MKRGARVIEVTEDPFSVGTWIHEVDGTIITDKDLPLHHPSEVNERHSSITRID